MLYDRFEVKKRDEQKMNDGTRWKSVVFRFSPGFGVQYCYLLLSDARLHSFLKKCIFACVGGHDSVDHSIDCVAHLIFLKTN